MSIIRHEDLMREIVDWLAARADPHLDATSFVHPPYKSDGPKPIQPEPNDGWFEKSKYHGQQMLEPPRKVIEKKTFFKGNAPDPLPTQKHVDRQRSLKLAIECFENKAETSEVHTDVVSVAEGICSSWVEPRAILFVRSWLSKKDLDKEVLMVLDVTTIGYLIGVAAAVTVLAIVLIVRRGHTISMPRREQLAPSNDFLELRRIADFQGQGKEIAEQLILSSKEPWNWSLLSTISSIPENEKRALLEAYLRMGSDRVETVRPKAGHLFNPSLMTSSTSITKEDCWLVVAEPVDERFGFLVDKRCVMAAKVDVCTADWFVLSKADCPVGKVLAESTEGLIAGGRQGAINWRASWGFTHPEDLRERLHFDEKTLDVWRTRMVTELNKHYAGRPDRSLAITGEVGAFFELSTMECPEAQPVGDAAVVEMVERDGVPQHGIACPGGSPLLLAVVKTIPTERAAS